MKREANTIPPEDDEMECSDIGYDPRKEFAKFLKEAKKNAGNTQKQSYALQKPLVAAFTAKDGRARSWKSIFVFWRKHHHKEPEAGSMQAMAGRIPPLKRRAASGPIEHRTGANCMSRSAKSGPLAAWFTPKRTRELGLHYVSLGQDAQAPEVKAFGPIYHVT